MKDCCALLTRHGLNAHHHTSAKTKARRSASTVALSLPTMRMQEHAAWDSMCVIPSARACSQQLFYCMAALSSTEQRSAEQCREHVLLYSVHTEGDVQPVLVRGSCHRRHSAAVQLCTTPTLHANGACCQAELWG